MKARICALALVFTILLLLLLGCENPAEKKTLSLSFIYGAATLVSLALLACYCTFLNEKDNWFFLLFTSVFIVNVGYFCISISKTLSEALLANRISYLGSTFLVLSMLMTILNVTKVKYKKFIPIILFFISAAVFIVAASPGYLDIYYKSVTIETVDGITVLRKEYGPWHWLYAVYLLSYFAAMVVVTVYSRTQHKLKSNLQAVVLASAVFGNILVWLVEQFVDITFEFLSITYIMSELFLLGLYLILQEGERIFSPSSATQEANAKDTKQDVPEADGLIESHESPQTLTHTEPIESEKETAVEEQADESLTKSTNSAAVEHFRSFLPTLTHTEKIIYNFYLQGRSTKEIMTELNITENTLKYHNKNIYGKLGVSSRKQLLEIASQMNAEDATNN